MARVRLEVALNDLPVKTMILRNTRCFSKRAKQPLFENGWKGLSFYHSVETIQTKGTRNLLLCCSPNSSLGEEKSRADSSEANLLHISEITELDTDFLWFCFKP